MSVTVSWQSRSTQLTSNLLQPDLANKYSYISQSIEPREASTLKADVPHSVVTNQVDDVDLGQAISRTPYLPAAEAIALVGELDIILMDEDTPQDDEVSYPPHPMSTTTPVAETATTMDATTVEKEPPAPTPKEHTTHKKKKSKKPKKRDEIDDIFGF